MLRWWSVSGLVGLGACASLADQADESEVYSEHTDTTYVLRTYVPDAAAADAPLLVVLDGDWYTDAAIRQVEAAVTDGIVAPVVVTVGYVGVNQRGRDFTPTEMQANPGSGGWAAYLDALRDDLLPAMPDASRRVWFGHSLGGLAVSYLQFDAPELADGVVAASPSYWWDEGVAFDAMQRAKAANQPLGPLWIGTGSQESFGMVPMAQAMADEIGDEASFTLLEGRDHGSAVSPAMAAGLRALLGAQP